MGLVLQFCWRRAKAAKSGAAVQVASYLARPRVIIKCAMLLQTVQTRSDAQELQE